jgi:hypothetical protein
MEDSTIGNLPSEWDFICSVCYTFPFPVMVNDSVSFLMEIKTIGKADFVDAPYAIEIYLDNLLVSEYRATRYLYTESGFYPKYKFVPAEPGVYQYKIIIDPKNILAETNETNNNFEGRFEVYRSMNQFEFTEGIHKNDLKNFRGRVIVSKDSGNIITNTFTKYSLKGNIGYSRNLYAHFNDNYEELTVGYPDCIECEDWALEIPEKNLLITMLGYPCDGESSDLVLVFWNIRADSLYFNCYERKIYRYSFSILSLKEYMTFPDGSVLIVLKSTGGDDRDYWGGYYLIRYRDDKYVERILWKGYDNKIGDAIPDTTISYELFTNKENHLIVKFIEDHFNSAESDYSSELISSDTSYIDLWEIINQKDR